MLKIGIGIAFVALLLVARWLHQLGPGYSVKRGGVSFYHFDNTDWKRKVKPLPEADPKTFRRVRASGGRYGKDAHQVFFETTDIRGADPASFQVLDWRATYSRDQHRVYWASIAISKDPEHFEILSNAYARDQTHVYFGARSIPGADPVSFEVTDITTGKGRDQYREYVHGRPQSK